MTYIRVDDLAARGSLVAPSLTRLLCWAGWTGPSPCLLDFANLAFPCSVLVFDGISPIQLYAEAIEAASGGVGWLVVGVMWLFTEKFVTPDVYVL